MTILRYSFCDTQSPPQLSQRSAIWSQWQSTTLPTTFDLDVKGTGAGKSVGGRNDEWARLRDDTGSEDHRSADKLIKQHGLPQGECYTVGRGGSTLTLIEFTISDLSEALE